MRGSYSHHSRLVVHKSVIAEARLQLARFLEAEALVEEKKFAAVEEYAICCAVRTWSKIIIPVPRIAHFPIDAVVCGKGNCGKKNSALVLIVFRA